MGLNQQAYEPKAKLQYSHFKVVGDSCMGNYHTEDFWTVVYISAKNKDNANSSMSTGWQLDFLKDTLT